MVSMEDLERRFTDALANNPGSLSNEITPGFRSEITNFLEDIVTDPLNPGIGSDPNVNSILDGYCWELTTAHVDFDIRLRAREDNEKPVVKRGPLKDFVPTGEWSTNGVEIEGPRKGEKIPPLLKGGSLKTGSLMFSAHYLSGGLVGARNALAARAGLPTFSNLGPDVELVNKLIPKRGQIRKECICLNGTLNTLINSFTVGVLMGLPYNRGEFTTREKLAQKVDLAFSFAKKKGVADNDKSNPFGNYGKDEDVNFRNGLRQGGPNWWPSQFIYSNLRYVGRCTVNGADDKCFGGESLNIDLDNKSTEHKLSNGKTLTFKNPGDVGKVINEIMEAEKKIIRPCGGPSDSPAT